MVPLRRIYWLWLVLGIALLAQGINTGGGIAGLLFYWQLQAFGTIFPATHLFLSIPLFFAPIVALARDADRRRVGPIDVFGSAKRLGRWFNIGGLACLLGAGLCYWRTTFFPDPHAVPRRIVLDEIQVDVPESRSILVGTPQRIYSIRYEEVMNGRFNTSSKEYHNYVPVTRSGWTPNQPVRYLVDTRDYPFSLFFSPDGGGGGRYDSERGLLLRHQLPVYVRKTFERKGLRIDNDAMVLSGEADFGRIPWLVSSTFCSMGALLGLAMGWAWPRTRLRSETELAALRPRVARYLAFGIGGTLILISLVLAARKVQHIALSASTDGVITAVQESSHDITKYSFYVKYSTPEGHFEGFAFTSTLFEKNIGEKVVLIYKPGKPGYPEILALDEEWVGCAIIFLPGLVVSILGAVLFRSRGQ